MTTTNTKTLVECKECGVDIVWWGPGKPWCDDCAAASLGPHSCVADLIAERDRLKEEAAAAWRGRNRAEDGTLAANAGALAEIATLRARCERLEALLGAFVAGMTKRPDGDFDSVVVASVASDSRKALAGEGT